MKKKAAKDAGSLEYGLDRQSYASMTLDNVRQGYTLLSQSLPGGAEAFNADSKKEREQLFNLIKGTESKIKDEYDILWEMTGARDFQIEDLDNKLVKEYMSIWLNRLAQFNAGVITQDEYRSLIENSDVGPANANYSESDTRPHHPIDYARQNAESEKAGIKPQKTEKRLMRDIKQRVRNIAWWKKRFKEKAGVSYDALWLKAAELSNFGEYNEPHYATDSGPVKEGLSDANIFTHARGNVIETFNIRNMLKGSNNVLNSDPHVNLIEDTLSDIRDNYSGLKDLDYISEVSKSTPIKIGDVDIFKPLFLKVEAQSQAHQAGQSAFSKNIWLKNLRDATEREEEHLKESEEKLKKYKEYSKTSINEHWDDQHKKLVKYFTKSIKEQKERLLKLEEERKIIKELTGYAKTDLQSKKNLVSLVKQTAILKLKEEDIDWLLKATDEQHRSFGSRSRIDKLSQISAKELLHGIGVKQKAVAKGRGSSGDDRVSEIHRRKLTVIRENVQDFFIAKILAKEKIPHKSKAKGEDYKDSLLETILFDLAALDKILVDNDVQITPNAEVTMKDKMTSIFGLDYMNHISNIENERKLSREQKRKRSPYSLPMDNGIKAAKKIFDELLWHHSAPSTEREYKRIDKSMKIGDTLSAFAVEQMELDAIHSILLGNKDFIDLADVIKQLHKQKQAVKIELNDKELKVSTILGKRWYADQNNYYTSRSKLQTSLRFLKISLEVVCQQKI